MYQIEYKKRNGEIIKWIRNTLPGKIGETTSMGWIIMDIKYAFKDKYYSLRDYQILFKKQSKINRINRTINKFLKKYATTMALVVLVPLYLIK